GVRRNEADPLLLLWRRACFHRNHRRLCQRRFTRLEPARPIPIYPAITIVGLPGFVPGLRCPRRHLAIAHLCADRSRGRADGGLDVARWNCDETRSLRRAAGRDESFPARLPNVE